MNTLIVLVLVTAFATAEYTKHYHGPQAIPVVQHDGYLADTHEVAVAKNAHLAALSKASSHLGGDYIDYRSAEDGAHSHGSYHGPLAVPKVLPDGFIADTHEVAAAKSAHLAALVKAGSAGSYGTGYSGGDYENSVSQGAGGEYNTPYHGPLAKPVVLPSGYLADTHEVAAAREAHLHKVNGIRHF